MPEIKIINEGARSHLPFMERELLALDVQADVESVEARDAVPLQWHGVEEVFGSMYVVEGSALGGQVLARGAARRLGLGPEHGAAYFHGWGDATGAMWRDFRLCLDRAVGSAEPMQARACAGAVATFDALIAVFRRALHVDAAA